MAKFFKAATELLRFQVGSVSLSSLLKLFNATHEKVREGSNKGWILPRHRRRRRWLRRLRPLRNSNGESQRRARLRHATLSIFSQEMTCLLTKIKFIYALMRNKKCFFEHDIERNPDQGTAVRLIIGLNTTVLKKVKSHCTIQPTSTI